VPKVRVSRASVLAPGNSSFADGWLHLERFCWIHTAGFCFVAACLKHPAQFSRFIGDTGFGSI
jgi:hypothetical protein